MPHGFKDFDPFTTFKPRTTRSGRKFSRLLDAVLCGIQVAKLFCRAFKRDDARGDEGDSDIEDDDIEDDVNDDNIISPQGPTDLTHTTPPHPPTTPINSQYQTRLTTRRTTAAPPGKIEKARGKDRSRLRRSESKAKQKLLHPNRIAFRPRFAAAERLIITGMKTKFDTSRLRVSSNCWIALRKKATKSSQWTVDELKGRGFDVLKWDATNPKVVLDVANRIIVPLAGRPQGEDWDQVIRDATAAMNAVRIRGERLGIFTAEDKEHRRGHFTPVTSGVSYGGGQTKPGNLRLSKAKQGLVDELRDNPAIQRVAGWQSCAFAIYAPKLFDEYRYLLSDLFDHDLTLIHNFEKSIFTASTFNLGPNTITLDHTDSANVAHGLCAITALGDYDYTLGGHMIIFDLKLIIEFPPGSTILIPSAVFRHGNTPIQPGETRMSFTQFVAGGLFRWVKYGFRTKDQLILAEGKARLLEINGNYTERCERALSLFSKLTELNEDRRRVFAK